MASKQIKQARMSVSELLALFDMDEEEISIPPWGVAIKVRPLTLHEVSALTKVANAATEPGKLYGLLLAASAIEPEFTEAQAEQLFTTKSAKSLKFLIDGLDRVNGFGEGEQKEKVAAETEDAFLPE